MELTQLTVRIPHTTREEQREKYDIKVETIVKYFESFVGEMENDEVKKRVLDIFVDKIYIYKDKMIITFHFSVSI